MVSPDFSTRPVPSSLTNIRVATAGEALIDMVMQDDGRLLPCAGGATYNLSRALGQQSVPTLYLNPLSQDCLGQSLRAGLQRAGVALAQPQPVAAPTALAMVALDAAGKASYSFYRDGVADRQITTQMLQACCAPSVAPGLALVATGCLALLPEDQAHYLPWLRMERARGRCVVVDANLRPAVAADMPSYQASVHAALQEAHVIKVSDEDLMVLGLADTVAAAGPIAAARSLLQRTRAQLLALTLGAQGAVLLSRAGPAWQAQEAQPVTVVDTVGAGDCFLAGLIAALLDDPSLLTALSTQPSDHTQDHTQPSQLLTRRGAQALLHRAIATASLCIQVTGCVPPNAAQLQQRMTKVALRLHGAN